MAFMIDSLMMMVIDSKPPFTLTLVTGSHLLGSLSITALKLLIMYPGGYFKSIFIPVSLLLTKFTGWNSIWILSSSSGSAGVRIGGSGYVSGGGVSSD